MKILNDLLSNHGAVILSSQELKNVKGGSHTYSCYCGFTGGPYEDMVISVEAESVGDALNSMNCGGAGATCNG